MCQLAAGTGGRYFYPVSSVPSLLDRIAAEERLAAAPGGETIERSEERVAGVVQSAAQAAPAAESPGGEIRE
jgi:hypothetical protein